MGRQKTGSFPQAMCQNNVIYTKVKLAVIKLSLKNAECLKSQELNQSKEIIETEKLSRTQANLFKLFD